MKKSSPSWRVSKRTKVIVKWAVGGHGWSRMIQSTRIPNRGSILKKRIDLGGYVITWFLYSIIVFCAWLTLFWIDWSSFLKLGQVSRPTDIYRMLWLRWSPFNHAWSACHICQGSHTTTFIAALAYVRKRLAPPLPPLFFSIKFYALPVPLERFK